MSRNDDTGIPISEKHGVNPCTPICFWCGKEKNEIALLGKLPGDAEAPRAAVLDYTPCEACQALMDEGVTIAEVKNTPNAIGQPPLISSDKHVLYPTRAWCVVGVTEDSPYKTGDHVMMPEDQFQELIKTLPTKDL